MFGRQLSLHTYIHIDVDPTNERRQQLAQVMIKLHVLDLPIKEEHTPCAPLGSKRARVS